MIIKKKLKDLTFEEYKDWKEENCMGKDCSRCAFGCVNCSWFPDEYTCGGDGGDTCWINNKGSYSDKFLNQEIEIENILDKQEKEYLRNVIKPFKGIVKNISKQKIYSKYEYISICFSVPLDISYYCSTNYIYLPYFIKGTMYKNMEVGKEYTLEELGL